jgi:broad specificity phosphatase PhoE
VTRLVLCRHVAPGEDAAELAQRVTAYEPAALYTSPLERALRTSHILVHSLGRDAQPGLRVEPVVDDRLREIDFGDVEGLGFDELPPGLQRGLLREPTRVRFPGGETYAELQDRVGEALDEIARRHDGQTVVVVSHTGSIRAALARWLLTPDEAIFRLDQRYGAVNVVDLIEGTPVVRLVNG